MGEKLISILLGTGKFKKHKMIAINIIAIQKKGQKNEVFRIF
jgi:hypothetical protein